MKNIEKERMIYVMVLKSEFLNKEFEVETFDVPSPETGEVLKVVKHESIEDIINRQIPFDKSINAQIRYNFQFCEGLSYPAYICEITDIVSGRLVSASGSATMGSLSSSIAKKFPAEMAEKRAFDRAAIKFLAFPKKVYSSSEICVDRTSVNKENINPDVQKMPNNNQAAVASSTGQNQLKNCDQRPVMTQNSNSVQMDTTIPTQSAQLPNANVQNQNSVPQNAPLNNAVSATQECNQPGIDYSNYVLDFGLYAHQNKTLSQIAKIPGKKGLPWLQQIAISDRLQGKDKEAVNGYLKTINF